jgi:hypothetical protein
MAPKLQDILHGQDLLDWAKAETLCNLLGIPHTVEVIRLPDDGVPSVTGAGPSEGQSTIGADSATDLALCSELEERIVDVLTSRDGVVYLSSTKIAAQIQRNDPKASGDERAIRESMKRMRSRGWPIETTRSGSRIPPSKRRDLPSVYGGGSSPTDSRNTPDRHPS